MRETLYLRLQSTSPETPVAFCVTGPAAHSWPVSEAPLREVLERAADKRLVVLVPSADVRLMQVNVAARSSAKILQAAPYIVEDQLAEDVEDLHFALGDRQADGSHAIAIVARTKMDEWLAPLRAANLRPDQLIPELLCLPMPAQEPEPGSWSALAEHGQITVRTGACSGFVCSEEDLPALLQLADPEKKTTLRMALPRSYRGDLTALDWPLELRPGFGSALEALLHGYAAAQSGNLLQGDYSQAQGARRAWQPWRPAAALAAGWLLVAGVSHAVHAYSLGRELKLQNQTNEERFKTLFPSETRIVNLQVQLDQKTAALKGGTRSGGFLSLSETLARALAATPGLSLQSLQFRDGALHANLTGTDLQQAEQLQNWFAQSGGTRYERESLNSGSDGMQLRIKLGGT